MSDAQEKKQGGRRKGSGRKKKIENRATAKTVSMPDRVWERRRLRAWWQKEIF